MIGAQAASYGAVVILLIASVAVSIVLPQATWSFALLIALEAGAVIVAISRSRARALVWPLMALFAALAVGLTLLPQRSSHGVANLLSALILLSLPVVIVMRFRRDLYVTVESVLGAISIYLVIGLLYAALDSSVGAIGGQPFFAGTADATSSQYTYFSFVTLCTVGYGDLVPASGLARGLAVSEAVIGQLYLVTVIALVVGNLGRERQASRVRQ